METYHYRESALARDWIFNTLLFTTLTTWGLADEPPLCASYTPGERCLCDDFGITLYAEGLYFTTREHHLPLGITLAGFQPSDQIPPALDEKDFQGEVVRIRPNWNLGWRAGIGYTSSSDYWDLKCDWSSYRANSGQTLSDIELPAWNLWGYPDLANAQLAYDLAASWKLSYDLLHLDLGRAFWIGRCLTLRPHFGASAAWIDQTLAFVTDYQPLQFVPFDSKIDLGIQFSGGGLNGGFTLHLTNGCGLGVFGKVELTLLYGSFDSTLCQVELSENIAESSDVSHMGISAIQGAVGVNWNKTFCCNRYRLGLSIGWEFQNWNDLNRFPHYFGQLHRGIFHQEQTSLMLMGLTFGGAFDF